MAIISIGVIAGPSGAGEIRVLCWVLTSPKHHEDRAKHVAATWGKRCDILLFITSGPAAPNILPEHNVVVLNNITEGRQCLWNKTRRGHKYVYDNYFDKADWFLTVCISLAIQ